MCLIKYQNSQEQIAGLQKQRKAIVGYSVKAYYDHDWFSFINGTTPWHQGETISSHPEGFHFFCELSDALKFLRTNEWGESLRKARLTGEHQGLFLLIIDTEDLLALGLDAGLSEGVKVGTAKKVYWDGTIIEEGNKQE